MSSSEPNGTEIAVKGCGITGELNIHSAAAVQRILLEALSGGADHIDLSAVEKCDAIGLQLLLSARKSGLRVTAMSPVIAEAAAAIGISPEELNESCSYPMP